jgi:hypothetical protein
LIDELNDLGPAEISAGPLRWQFKERNQCLDHKFYIQEPALKGLLAMEIDPNQRPDLRVNQASGSSAGNLVFIVIGIILLAGVFIFFTTSWTSPPGGPEVTQNNTALPPPIIEVPAPASPPASQKTAPPADAPAYNP